MKLVTNWRRVIRRAWSWRLIVLAGLLSGGEVALSVIGYALPVPPLTLAALSFVVSCAALVARLVAQDKLHGDQ